MESMHGQNRQAVFGHCDDALDTQLENLVRVAGESGNVEILTMLIDHINGTYSSARIREVAKYALGLSDELRKIYPADSDILMYLCTL